MLTHKLVKYSSTKIKLKCNNIAPLRNLDETIENTTNPIMTSAMPMLNIVIYRR